MQKVFAFALSHWCKKINLHFALLHRCKKNYLHWFLHFASCKKFFACAHQWFEHGLQPHPKNLVTVNIGSSSSLSICISMPYDVFWYLMVLLPPTSTIVTLIDDVRTTTHSQRHNHIFRISNWKFSVDEAQHSTWRVGFFPLGLILLLEHNLILKPSRMSLYFSPYMRAGVESRVTR